MEDWSLLDQAALPSSTKLVAINTARFNWLPAMQGSLDGFAIELLMLNVYYLN